LDEKKSDIKTYKFLYHKFAVIYFPMSFNMFQYLSNLIHN